MLDSCQFILVDGSSATVGVRPGRLWLVWSGSQTAARQPGARAPKRHRSRRCSVHL